MSDKMNWHNPPTKPSFSLDSDVVALETFKTAAPCRSPTGYLRFYLNGFLRSQSHLHNIRDLIFSQNTRYTNEDIILYSIEYFNHSRNWVHSPKILHYTFCQIFPGEFNGPGSVAFSFDHFIGTINHLFVNLFPVLLSPTVPNSGYRFLRMTPGTFTLLYIDTGISMLPEDSSMAA